MHSVCACMRAYVCACVGVRMPADLDPIFVSCAKTFLHGTPITNTQFTQAGPTHNPCPRGLWMLDDPLGTAGSTHLVNRPRRIADGPHGQLTLHTIWEGRGRAPGREAGGRGSVWACNGHQHGMTSRGRCKHRTIPDEAAALVSTPLLFLKGEAHARAASRPNTVIRRPTCSPLILRRGPPPKPAPASCPIPPFLARSSACTSHSCRAPAACPRAPQSACPCQGPQRLHLGKRGG